MLYRYVVKLVSDHTVMFLANKLCLNYMEATQNKKEKLNSNGQQFMFRLTGSYILYTQGGHHV